MNPLIRRALLGSLIAVSPVLFGQTSFSVGDDFSSVVVDNWFMENSTGTGAFNVTDGVLNYQDGGLIGGGTSTGHRDWKPNAGSYTADWQAQIDFTFNLAQDDGQMSSWSLYIGNLADATPNDYLRGLFMLSTSGTTPNIMVIGQYYTNDSLLNTFPYEPKQKFDATNSITLKATYLAASHTLSLYYDKDGSGTGSGFELVTSAAIDGTGLSWGMSPTDGFGFRLAADNNATLGTALPLTAGKMFADNFAASSSIPEPATYATLLGALALLAAGWRRRVS